jgi:Zn-dependent protease
MTLVFSLIILLFSMVIHEIAHGSVALSLGDPTAKNAGRITLNPLKHLDPFNSVILPLLTYFILGVAFGGAKPVPINPFNFRDQKWGNLKVAIAGPGANLAIALIFGLILRFAFNFLPAGLIYAFFYAVFINILLAVFNLIPIPPLDGSHILFTFLPHSLDRFKISLSQYGFFILIFLIFLVPGFFYLLFRIINLIILLITGHSITI